MTRHPLSFRVSPFGRLPSPYKRVACFCIQANISIRTSHTSSIDAPDKRITYGILQTHSSVTPSTTVCTFGMSGSRRSTSSIRSVKRRRHLTFNRLSCNLLISANRASTSATHCFHGRPGLLAMAFILVSTSEGIRVQPPNAKTSTVAIILFISPLRLEPLHRLSCA